jgi:carboxypeptidase C (cathepsin A)
MTDESASAGEKKSEKDGKDDKPIPPELVIETRHALPDGTPYVATAATLHLKNENGDPVGEVFHTIYTRGEKPDARRPILFAFNGGPGSASAWLHLGAWGPVRAELPDPEFPKPPPYQLVQNAETLLPFADLVFVDPIGTGISRAIGKGKLADFTGVKEDLVSMSELIRLFLTRHGRWNSPRFLAGESYGGTRVAGLAAHLFDRGIAVNGVVLVSPALDLAHLEFQFGNLVPNALFLPSYAALAAYHGTLVEKPKDLAVFLREVRAFAIDEYLPALFHGAGLDAARRTQVIAKLVSFTGLPAAWIAQQGLRLVDARVLKELLRGRGVTVGRLDARYLGHETDLGHSEMQADPAHHAAGPAFTTLANEYLRGTLGVKDEREYELLSMAVNAAWKWGMPEKDSSGGFVNVVRDLRRAMLSSPHTHVLFCNGMYDLATPFFGAEIAARQLGSEPGIVSRVHERTYEAGHMMYFHANARKNLTKDVAELIAKASG